jgi:hypothetical protein
MEGRAHPTNLHVVVLVLVAIASVFLLRGNGRQATWVLVVMVPLAVGLLLSGDYRFAWQRLIWRQWRLTRQYALRTQDRAASQRLRPLPWRAAGLFVVLPLLAMYLLNNTATDAQDTKPALYTAISLATEGNFDIGEFYRDTAGQPLPDESLPYNVRVVNERRLSNYPIGMTLPALPVVLSSRILGADLPSKKIQFRLEKLIGSSVSALAMGVFFLIALHMVSPGAALLAAYLLGLGSTMFSTNALGLWQHGGVVLWSLVILLIEFRQPASGWRGTLVQAICCALLLMCRLSSGVFILLLGIWILVRDPKRAITLGLLSGVAALPWVLLNMQLYDNLVGPSGSQMEGSRWGSPLGWPLVGVLFSPSRGLFTYQPWLILVLISAAFEFRATRKLTTAPSGWWLVCGVTLLAHILLVSAWSMWWGGHCWGSRLLAGVIPLGGLLILPAIGRLWRYQAGRVALIALLLISTLPHWPRVLTRAAHWNAVPVNVDEHQERLWSWSDSPLLHAFRE